MIALSQDRTSDRLQPDELTSLAAVDVCEYSPETEDCNYPYIPARAAPFRYGKASLFRVETIIVTKGAEIKVLDVFLSSKRKDEFQERGRYLIPGEKKCKHISRYTEWSSTVRCMDETGRTPL